MFPECPELRIRKQKQLTFFGFIEQQRVIDVGHGLARELDIHHGANALNNVSLTHRHILKI
jgi:hypothetical protein